MNSGVISASSTLTKMKFPSALATNNELAGAGETRYASSTWFRNSRAHVWLSATTAANRNATHTSPPAISRDSSALGSNEKLKITTTSSEKNSIEFKASFERHSNRMSFTSVADSTAQNEVIAPVRARPWPYDQQSAPPASTRTHRQRPPAALPGGSPQKSSCPHHACP